MRPTRPLLVATLALVVAGLALPENAHAYLYDSFGAGPGWPNRVDDRIDAMNPTDLVDIIVDFCSTPTSADSTFLAGYGTVFGVFRFIDAIAVRGVVVSDCYNIVAYPRVKLIEWDQPLQLHLDVSACAIQARSSPTYPYPSQAVWDLNPSVGYMGNGVTVAIIDSGVDDGHPALAGKFVAGYDGFTGQGGPGVNPDDDIPNWFHGTAVAGIILGNDPTQQYMGVAPGAGLVDVKIFDPQGNSAPSIMVAAVQWVMQNASTYGIKVANMSFGGFNDDGTDNVARAADALAASGVVVVASAGNYPATWGVSSPGSGDAVICVGGVDDGGTVLRGDDVYDVVAKYGPRNAPPPSYVTGFNDLKPEVAAYMRNITTCRGSDPGQGGTGFWQHPGTGTSWATAHVSGVVALLLEKYPGLTPTQVDDMLRLNAEPRGAPTYPFLDPVWNHQYGWGIVSAANTVNAVLPVDVSVKSWVPGTWSSQSIWAGHYPVRVGDPNTLNARIFAKGGPAAGVVVSFDVMNFGWGSPWLPIASTTVSVPWDGSVVATIPYTPPPGMDGHKCFRVTAAYPPDTNPANNTAQENIDVQPAPSAVTASRSGQRYAFPVTMCVEPTVPFPFRTAAACICTKDLPAGASAWLEPEPPFDLPPGQCQPCSLIVQAAEGVSFQPGHAVYVNGWFWGNGVAEGGVTVYFVSQPPMEATIAEVQYTDDPTGPSPLTGQVVTVSGIATAGSDTYPDRIAIQDGEGPWNGVFVRDPGVVVLGDAVTVTGTVVETGALTEIDLVSTIAVTSGGNPLPPPTVLDPGEVGSSEAYEGVLVRVENVTVVGDNPDDWLVASNGICHVGRWAGYAYTPVLDDELHVTGIVGSLDDLRRIQPRSDDDIVPATGVPGDGLPTRASLSQNLPNPFRGGTGIEYGLPVESAVLLRVYSVGGRLVRVLVDGRQPAGRWTVAWDGRDDAGAPVSSGVYFYRLETDGRTVAKRMVMVE
ncbi:MAG: S8 family serine peptidase [Candidatus Eisenbacteria bacterium]|nr:S8 family serine peptidase [Candidatus Eisenbacteria bacterium]